MDLNAQRWAGTMRNGRFHASQATRGLSQPQRHGSLRGARATRTPIKPQRCGVLNTELGRNYTLDDVPDQPRDPWEPGATDLHRRWWEQRIARQKEIDASIAANADYEYLYDKPYEDRA